MSHLGEYSLFFQQQKQTWILVFHTFPRFFSNCRIPSRMIFAKQHLVRTLLSQPEVRWMKRRVSPPSLSISTYGQLNMWNIMCVLEPFQSPTRWWNASICTRSSKTPANFCYCVLLAVIFKKRYLLPVEYPKWSIESESIQNDWLCGWASHSCCKFEWAIWASY